MSAAETIPFTPGRSVPHSPPPPVSPSLNPEPRTLNPPWSPTDRDRLIFQWVKFDGHKQSWVATQLGMHQTTVSRIVDRYERWIAHGGPSQQGGLSRDERIRAQRYLTYERNEWILNSALRIAAEMEMPIDISTSNIKKQPRDHTKELEVRTQHAILHRSGLAARFLRLAHRINMDQQKLVERDPLPDLEPLSLHDLSPDEDNLPAVADTPDVGWAVPTTPAERLVPAHDVVAGSSNADDVVAGSPDPTVMAGSPDPATAPTEGLPTDYHEQSENANPAPDLPASAPSPPMHPTHTNITAESPLTDSPASAYDQKHPTKKISTPAYAVALSPPESLDSVLKGNFPSSKFPGPHQPS